MPGEIARWLRDNNLPATLRMGADPRLAALDWSATALSVSASDLPAPPERCDTSNGNPTTEGYQFQLRITLKGWSRLRGLLLYALPRQRAPFKGIVC